ncbi:MAG: hypothetical protein ACKVVP_23325 [Chloroflexota bacterium]
MPSYPVVNPPPSRDPGGGREYFLPDEELVWELPTELVWEIEHVIVRVLARWGDRYVARNIMDPKYTLSGNLQGSQTDREAEIESAWRQVVAWAQAFYMVSIDVAHKDDWLTDQHDGLPGHLILSRDQFNIVREALQVAGLPAEVYYPASDQRIGTEYQTQPGGVVLVERRYTPRQWARRGDSLSLAPPSDAERREAFLVETTQYLRALGRRLMELKEPGRVADTEHIERLERLVSETYRTYRMERDKRV